MKKEILLLMFPHLVKKCFPPFMEPEPILRVHRIQQALNTDLSLMNPTRILQRVARRPFFPGHELFLRGVFGVRALFC